jgi:hypothetical protein
MSEKAGKSSTIEKVKSWKSPFDNLAKSLENQKIRVVLTGFQVCLIASSLTNQYLGRRKNCVAKFFAWWQWKNGWSFAIWT